MAYRNQFGRVNNTKEAVIEWQEARASAISSRYTEMISAASILERQFAAAGDTECAAIAAAWGKAAMRGYHKAQRVGLNAEKHARRKRIDRMQAVREDAYHRRMGWTD